MRNMKISYTRIEPNKLSHVRFMVTKEAYERLESGKSFAVGAYDDEKCRMAGVLVYRRIMPSDDPRESEILIDSVYVEPQYRGHGICRIMLRRMQGAVKSEKGILGIGVNLTLPELQTAADSFTAMGFKRRAEGNQIYRIPIENLIGTMVKRLIKLKKKALVFSLDEFSAEQMDAFWGSFGKNFPRWMHPDTYGGVFQKSLSFGVIKLNGIAGFIGTSLYPGGELYVGGIYTPPNDGLMVGALLGSLTKACVEQRPDIATVMFSLATPEGVRLGEHLFRNVPGIPKPQVVVNYYKKWIDEE